MICRHLCVAEQVGWRGWCGERCGERATSGVCSAERSSDEQQRPVQRAAQWRGEDGAGVVGGVEGWGKRAGRWLRKDSHILWWEGGERKGARAGVKCARGHGASGGRSHSTHAPVSPMMMYLNKYA